MCYFELVRLTNQNSKSLESSLESVLHMKKDPLVTVAGLELPCFGNLATDLAAVVEGVVVGNNDNPAKQPLKHYFRSTESQEFKQKFDLFLARNEQKLRSLHLDDDKFRSNLDKVLGTSFTSKDASVQSDPLYLGLISFAIIAPLTSLITKIIAKEQELASEDESLDQDLTALKKNLFQIARKQDPDLIISTILDNQKINHVEQLDVISRFDLSKITDAKLRTRVYDLLFKDIGAGNDPELAQRILLRIFYTNLPKIEYPATANILVECMCNFDYPAEAFRVLAEFFAGPHASPECVQELAPKIIEYFKENVEINLLRGVGEKPDLDVDALAFQSGALFREMAKKMGADTRGRLQNVVNDLIRASIYNNHTLSGATLILLNQLTRKDSNLSPRDFLNKRLDEVVNFGTPLLEDLGTLVVAQRTLCRQTFDNNRITKYKNSKNANFGPELKWLYDSLVETGEPRLSVVNALKRHESDEEVKFALRWAPELLPEEAAQLIKEAVLDTQDPYYDSSENLDKVFSALMNCGEQGEKVLLDLVADGVDPSKPLHFYEKLIDAVFMCFSDSKTVQTYSQENKHSPISELMNFSYYFRNSNKKTKDTEFDSRLLARFVVNLHKTKFNTKKPFDKESLIDRAFAWLNPRIGSVDLAEALARLTKDPAPADRVIATRLLQLLS